MAIEITRKGYWRLHVNGAFFSQHVVPDEGYEKASKVLEAEPSAVVVLLPPRIEITADAPAAPPPPSSEPVLSDKGEDLIDFLARVSGYGEPSPGGTIIVGTGDLHRDIDRLTEAAKDKLMGSRLYADADGDGKPEWVGITWRGFALEWWQRVRGAINIGVD